MAIMYCPNCEKENECVSLNLTNFDDKNHMQCYEDIHFFKRFRKCQNCDSIQATVEIEFEIFAKLLVDQNFLRKIKNLVIKTDEGIPIMTVGEETYVPFKNNV